MKLDYNVKTGDFILWAPQNDAEQIVREHGLNLSTRAAAPPGQACLYTPIPYAAVAFLAHATPAAAAELNPIALEIAASWQYTPTRHNWPGTLAPQNASCVPYPLQLADLEYAARRQHTLVADEPGVGKTPTAIMYGNLLAWERGRPDRFRALVICPASIRLQWAERIRQWSTIPDTRTSVVATASRGIPHTDGSTHWTIMSYDGASTHTAAKAIVEQKCRYDVLVLDEAHYLKSATTARTRAIFGAADKGSCIANCAAHVLALTGTPIPNRPREAFPLAARLCPEVIDYMSQRAFNERFNPRAKRKSVNDKEFIQEGVGRVHELQARLRTGFMVRHLFADAFPQLRLPLYDLVYAEATHPVRQALAAERLLDIDPETFTGADGKIDGAVSTARKQMGIALAPQVVKYIQMLHTGGEDKIVVFGWHIEVLDFIQTHLDKIGVVRVDGRTSEHEKAKAVVAFQKDPKIGVILGNVLSLGVGTDGLQAVARRVVLAEPDWVHGNNEQCIKRVYRSGQTGQVLADIVVAPGSISERVLAAALRKGRVVHKALDERI